MIKKKSRIQKKKLSDTINLIPMINLIFLLLIFFLLTGVVSKKDTIKVERPVSEFGQEIEFVKDEVTFIINNENEIIYKNETIKVEDVSKFINSTEIKHTIDIDKNAKVSTFNEIIKKLKDGNLKKVYIKVSESKNE